MNFRKLLTLFLTVAMLLTLCACGADGTDSTNVTLKWVIPAGEQKDQDKVMEKFNEMLANFLPDTKLDLVRDSTMSDKWATWMASGEPIDIAWSGYMFDMVSEISKKSYQPLDELVQEYAPNIQKEMELYPDDYASGKHAGVLYAIPNVQPIIKSTPYIRVPASLIEYMDVDALLSAAHASPTTTEDVYKVLDSYLAKVKASGKMDSDIISNGMDIAAILEAVVPRGYDFVYHKGTTAAAYCYRAFDENPEIVLYGKTEEYQTFLKYAAKWYDAGYIAKDILVSGGSGGERLATLGAHTTENWYGIDEERGVRYEKDEDGDILSYHILLSPEKYLFNGATITGTASTYEVIPTTAENPERAMQLLDLLHSEEGEELFNLLVYGFEGTHYTLENDVAYGNGYTIQPSSQNDYGIAHWLLGNVFLCYRTPNILDGQKEYAQKYFSEIKPAAHKTPLYGFEADVSAWSSKIPQIQQACKEFEDSLKTGVLGSSKYQQSYADMLKKMDAAGMSELEKELNAQAQAFLNH